jgi:hypothetical protein
MRENDNTEKRKTMRYDMASTIEYVSGARTSGEVYKGVPVNISTSGIGAYVFHPHTEEERIFITSRLPVDCQAATIAWITKEDDFYLARLKFADQGT